jgi:hypothetical protein
VIGQSLHLVIGMEERFRKKPGDVVVRCRVEGERPFLARLYELGESQLREVL